MGEICGCISKLNMEGTKNLIISIDGEIENKEEICKNLNIKTNKDIEILEKLYIKYGKEFVQKIEGGFAISIYNKKENELILARDKIGRKPLYYFIKENSICFASELKSIMKYPDFEKEINYDVLSRYFRYSYISPPDTIFKNTYKLEHGHYIVWKDGKIEDKIYWDSIERFNYLSKNTVNNFEEAKENVKTIIEKYLERVINSNNNFGVYLSGGIDSSLMASICTEICEKPINTFSVGFYEKDRNEADNAKKIAEYLGTNHHEIYISKKDVIDILKKIPEYYDEPFADTSQIPTLILDKYAHENGIKVAITGDGADTLFCGSSIFDKVYKMQKQYKILNPLNLCINSNFVKETDLRYLYNNSDKRNQTQIDILGKEFILQGLFKDEGKKKYNFENKINSKNWQEKRMMIEINTYLASKINTKIYSSSAVNKIEYKSPFLENELIEYSFKVPQKYKYYKKNKKYIIKQILYEYLPKELFDNKKKGFGSPIKSWLNTYLYEDFKKVTSKDFIEKQNIFNYKKLQELIENKDEKFSKKIYQILWDFYMFQLWYMEYIEN